MLQTVCLTCRAQAHAATYGSKSMTRNPKVRSTSHINLDLNLLHTTTAASLLATSSPSSSCTLYVIWTVESGYGDGSASTMTEATPLSPRTSPVPHWEVLDMPSDVFTVALICDSDFSTNDAVLSQLECVEVAKALEDDASEAVTLEVEKNSYFDSSPTAPRSKTSSVLWDSCRAWVAFWSAEMVEHADVSWCWPAATHSSLLCAANSLSSRSLALLDTSPFELLATTL